MCGLQLPLCSRVLLGVIEHYLQAVLAKGGFASQVASKLARLHGVPLTEHWC